MICIIVRQGQLAFQDYDRLYEAFGHLVPVIWDRRRADLDLDTALSANHPNRREKPPLSWTVFGYVIVDRSAEWTWAAVSACEADHYIAAQAEPASQ